jgi:Carbohydrate esterase, sialic acid-specific acetylesterase
VPSTPVRRPLLVLLSVSLLCLGCGLSEFPLRTGVGDAAGTGTGGSDGGTVAPPPGGGVVIAGTVVLKDRAIVFLHIGHSNMAGRSVNPTSERPFFYDTHPRLWAYAAGDAWRPAREPLAGDSMTRDRAGPGMAILRSALNFLPEAAHVISIGRGQSGQTRGYCRSYRRGGLLGSPLQPHRAEAVGRAGYRWAAKGRSGPLGRPVGLPVGARVNGWRSGATSW